MSLNAGETDQMGDVAETETGHDDNNHQLPHAELEHAPAGMWAGVGVASDSLRVVFPFADRPFQAIALSNVRMPKCNSISHTRGHVFLTWVPTHATSFWRIYLGEPDLPARRRRDPSASAVIFSSRSGVSSVARNRPSP